MPYIQKIKVLSSDAKLDSVLTEAIEEFWYVVAKHYPETKTGGMSPEMVLHMEDAVRKAVKHWLDVNKGEQTSPSQIH